MALRLGLAEPRAVGRELARGHGPSAARLQLLLRVAGVLRADRGHARAVVRVFAGAHRLAAGPGGRAHEDEDHAAIGQAAALLGVDGEVLVGEGDAALELLPVGPAVGAGESRARRPELLDERDARVGVGDGRPRGLLRVGHEPAHRSLGPVLVGGISVLRVGRRPKVLVGFGQRGRALGRLLLGFLECRDGFLRVDRSSRWPSRAAASETPRSSRRPRPTSRGWRNKRPCRRRQDPRAASARSRCRASRPRPPARRASSAPRPTIPI